MRGWYWTPNWGRDLPFPRGLCGGYGCSFFPLPLFFLFFFPCCQYFFPLGLPLLPLSSSGCYFPPSPTPPPPLFTFSHQLTSTLHSSVSCQYRLAMSVSWPAGKRLWTPACLLPLPFPLPVYCQVLGRRLAPLPVKGADGLRESNGESPWRPTEQEGLLVTLVTRTKWSPSIAPKSRWRTGKDLGNERVIMNKIRKSTSHSKYRVTYRNGEQEKE